jgi:hypothetical protein
LRKLPTLRLESSVGSSAEEVATYFADADLQAKDSERTVLLKLVFISNPTNWAWWS